MKIVRHDWNNVQLTKSFDKISIHTVREHFFALWMSISVSRPVTMQIGLYSSAGNHDFWNTWKIIYTHIYIYFPLSSVVSWFTFHWEVLQIMKINLRYTRRSLRHSLFTHRELSIFMSFKLNSVYNDVKRPRRRWEIWLKSCWSVSSASTSTLIFSIQVLMMRTISKFETQRKDSSKQIDDTRKRTNNTYSLLSSSDRNFSWSTYCAIIDDWYTKFASIITALVILKMNSSIFMKNLK